MLDVTTLAAIAFKTTALMAATGIVSLMLRRRSAALRHLLWTAALTLSVLMPLAVVYLPSQTLLTLRTNLSAVPAAGWPIAATLWTLGSLSVVTRELLACIGLARWRHRAQPLQSSAWAATLARVCDERGFDRKLRVLESPQVESPCTWGVLRPVLLVPATGNSWPESARRCALLHELAHVRRRDALSTLLSRLACVVHWYNPLVWLAAARARNLQERACDDAVLRAGAVPSDYAQFLLDVAARMSGLTRPGRPAIGMAHSSLRSRIVAILDPQATRAQPERAPVLAACSALFAITVLLGMASVATVPGEPVPPISPTPPIVPVPPVPPLPPTLPVSATP